MEVCPLSRRMILLVAQSLSARLLSGFRFLHPLVPTPPSASLTGCFPVARRDMGFPRFVLMPEWVRFTLFAGRVACSREEST
jgi:hypothetical protein